ncbi:hypothetical protein ACJJTC_011425 [Scirpophaga incertulas]
MFDPEDPGGTSPQVSSIVTIDCSGMETEGSILETDCSENASITNKRKRTSARKVCKHCNKRKRRHRDSSSNHDLDCLCENTQGTKLASDEHSEIVHIKPPTSQPQLQNMRYSDVKSLLQSKCGLNNLILDNLVSEGKKKKVTVGLAEDEDAAILIRNINGIYYEGNQLYVEDMRQSKPPAEQSYRPTQQNNLRSMNQSNNSTAQQLDSAQYYNQMGAGQYSNYFNNSPDMMSQQMMNNMYMFQNAFYQDPQQQMLFQQQQQMQQSQAPTLQERPSQLPNASERPNANEPNPSASIPYYQMNKSHYSPERDRNRTWQSSRDRSRSPVAYNKFQRGQKAGNDRYHNNVSYTENNNYGRGNASRLSNDLYSRRNSSPQRNTSYENYDSRRESKGWEPTSLMDIPEPLGWGSRSSQGWNTGSSSDFPYGRGPSTSTDKPLGWGPRSLTDNSPNWGFQSFADKPQNRGSSFDPNNSRNNVEQGNKSDKPYEHPPSVYRWVRDCSTNMVSGKNKQQAGAQFQNKPNSNINQPGSEPSKANKADYEKLLRKDVTWKNQAAAFLQKKISKSGECPPAWLPKFVKALRKAVVTRIELVLQEQIAVPVEDIVKRYRKTFPPRNDAAFFAAVFKTFKENIENEKNAPKAARAKAAVSDVKTEANTETASSENVVKTDATDTTKEVKAESAGSGNVVAADAAETSTTLPQQPYAENIVTVVNKPKGSNKPPKAGRLPKYVNADKAQNRKAKKMRKEEFEQEENESNKLEPNLDSALQEELNQLCAIMKAELMKASEPAHKIVCSGLDPLAINKFRQAVKVNMARRLLNKCSDLIVRVFPQGKPPNTDDVHDCLKKLGVVAAKKAVGKKHFYSVFCQSYEAYDNMLNMRSIELNNETILNFKPFQLIGPPEKIKKNKNKKKNVSQIGNNNQQSYENFDNVVDDDDFDGQDEDNIDMPGGSSEYGDDSKDVKQDLDYADGDGWNAEDFEDW